MCGKTPTKIEADCAYTIPYTLRVKMPILNFNDSANIQFNEIPETGLRLMLWAGDMVDEGITDIQRLPGYDVYLCYGFTPGLYENATYMEALDASGPSRHYLCVVNVHNKEQMGRFTDLFRGKFSVIDSDYRGNTPTLALEAYSALLVSGGMAFHTEGLNSLRMPQEEYLNVLELFAPVLTPKIAERRRWTRELIEEATQNQLTPGETWSSAGLKAPYYDGLRARQERFAAEQAARSPSYWFTNKYNWSNITDYWDTLPLTIVTTPLVNLPAELGFLADYAEKFRAYLVGRVLAVGETSLDEGHEDYRIYTEEVESISDSIKRCQHVLKMRGYCVTIGALPLLVPALKYFVDARGTRSPRREYGVTISKI